MNSFDFVSSFTISTLSTLLAFGTIPLNLLIYSGSWTDEEFVIPYRSILIVVGITITPLVLGVGIRWKFSKAASIILKVKNTKQPPLLYQSVLHFYVISSYSFAIFNQLISIVLFTFFKDW